MENVKVLKNYNKDNEEWKKDVNEKLDYLMDCYEGILTQQEILHLKSLSIEETAKKLLQNQKEMRNILEKILKRGDY